MTTVGLLGSQVLVNGDAMTFDALLPAEFEAVIDIPKRATKRGAIQELILESDPELG